MRERFTTEMTDQDWYQMLREGYDKKAAELIAAGWQHQNKGMSFVEHFTHPRRTFAVQIVRKLGSPQWRLMKVDALHIMRLSDEDQDID